MNQLVTAIRSIPPVTRFLCISSLVVTIPVLMELQHSHTVIFIPGFVTGRYEIWRIFTSFFLGSTNWWIFYAYDLFTLYRTANQLESGPFARKSADFAWQLILVGAFIVLTCLPLGTDIFVRPFIHALTYFASAHKPDEQIPQMFVGVLPTLPTKYIPYIGIFTELLMAGPGAAVQAIAGAMVGHFWWRTLRASEPGKGSMLESLGRAPAWLRSLVGDGNGLVRG